MNGLVEKHQKRNVLWIGTSIPAGDIQFNNNGTTQSITSSLGSNNYPKMIADRLGWNLYNNSRGASFVCFYPSSDDGTTKWAGNNVYHVTEEFSCDSWDKQKNARPDIVLFVNGRKIKMKYIKDIHYQHQWHKLKQNLDQMD